MQTITTSLARQIANSVETLKAAIDNADQRAWTYGDPPYYQIVFHAIYSLDMYLSTFNPKYTVLPDQYMLPDAFQTYSRIGFFDEPLDNYDSVELVLTKEAMLQYLSETRTRIRKYFSGDISSQFDDPAGFPWLNFSKFELILHNIRHVMGHTGVLNEYLKVNDCPITGWVGRRDL